MPKHVATDETGNTYGWLTVLRSAPSLLIGRDQRTKAAWVCKCACGKEKVISGQQLRSGRIKSCGCKLLLHRTRYRGVQSRRDSSYYSQKASFGLLNLIRRPDA